MKDGSSSDLKRISERRRSKFLACCLLFTTLLLTVGLRGIFLTVSDIPVPDVYDIPLCMSYYDSLTSDSDRELYDALQHAVDLAACGDSPFVDTGQDVSKDTEHLKQVAHMVLYDNPKYSAIWSTCPLQVSNKTAVRVKPSRDPDDMVPDSEYERLLKGLLGQTDYETAWNVFCYLKETVSYDADSPYSASDYGAMRKHKASCQGLSFAYKRFLDAVGIPCVVLTSHTDTGGYHMVDAINLRGHWYVCDVTGLSGGEYEFCMGNEDIERIFSKMVLAPVKNP